MNQLFSSELLSLISNKNPISLSSSDHSTHSSSGKTSNHDSEKEDEFISNIPQLGLYFETKEKITTNSSLPNDYLQYNFIRVSPLVLEEENTQKSMSMICDGSIVKISKPQNDKPSTIKSSSMSKMKENLYSNFGVDNNITPSLVTYHEINSKNL